MKTSKIYLTRQLYQNMDMLSSPSHIISYVGKSLT
nr:MAG TPA: hypothetical protein [Caudoviricetes sp.]